MKDKELPITGFEPKGNQFGLRDAFETNAGRLLIGGPLDGQRYVPRDIREFQKLVKPVPSPQPLPADISTLSPIAPEPTLTTYWPQVLRGNEIQMIFYQHESLSVDQALVLMLARYPRNEAIRYREGQHSGASDNNSL